MSWHKMTEQDAAYAAAAWASGMTQIQIARQFGYCTSATICICIGKFLDRYAVDDPRNDLIHSYVDARKALVPSALEAFKAAREASLT